MPGLRAGQPLRYYGIHKALSLKYLRTQYRKKFSAEDLDTFGEQASSTFSYEPGFFNSVYIILSSTQQDEKYVSNVSVNRYDNTGADPQLVQANLVGQEHLPQLTTNINTGNSPGVPGRSAGLPQATMGGRYVPAPVGPMFGIRGNSTVKVIHSVEAIRRSVPLHTAALTNSLQEQIDALVEHTHMIKHPYNHRKSESSEPIIHSDTDEEPDMIPNPKKSLNRVD